MYTDYKEYRNYMVVSSFLLQVPVPVRYRRMVRLRTMQRRGLRGYSSLYVTPVRQNLAGPADVHQQVISGGEENFGPFFG